MYELQNISGVILVCVHLATRAQAHGSVASGMPVWSTVLSVSTAICSSSPQATQETKVNEAVQAEILLGITAHVFWILAVVSKAIGWEELYTQLASCSDQCDEKKWSQFCHIDKMNEFSDEQRSALRKAYVLVLRNGGAEKGVGLIHRQLRSQPGLRRCPTPANLTANGVVGRFLSLERVGAELDNALGLLAEVSRLLTGEAMSHQPQIVLGVDELRCKYRKALWNDLLQMVTLGTGL